MSHASEVATLNEVVTAACLAVIAVTLCGLYALSWLRELQEHRKRGKESNRRDDKVD